MGRLVFVEKDCFKEDNNIYGMILTDHLISVDTNTVNFLKANSVDGCVEFMIQPDQMELVIRPVSDPNDHVQEKAASFVYLIDHDGQPHLQEATTFIGQLQNLLGLTPGQKYFFPGLFVESLKNGERPFIHFNLRDVISAALPVVDAHENAEIYAHRTAQRERYAWSDKKLMKRRFCAPLS